MRGKAVSRFFVVALATILIAGCSCGQTDLRGDAEAAGDSPLDIPIDEAEEVTDAEVDVGEDPCSLEGGLRVLSRVPVSEVGQAIDRPSMTWTGSEYALVWMGPLGEDSYLRFARVDTDGGVASERTLIEDAEGIRRCPSITWSGSEFGVAWDEHRLDIDRHLPYFERLDASGTTTMAGNDIGLDRWGSGWHSLVWTGSEYGIAWSTSRASPGYRMYFSRLVADGSASGTVVLLSDIPDFSSDNDYPPSMEWTGSEYAIAWFKGVISEYSSGDLAFARVNGDGVPQGDVVTHESLIATHGIPSMAWSGSRFGILHAWWFALMDPDGTVEREEIRDMSEIWWEGNVSLVWTGSEYLAAWPERPSYHDLYFVIRRLSISGETLEGGLRLPAGMYVDAMLWTGSELGIAWLAFPDAERPWDVYLYHARIGPCE
jgi:hypothetical protein